MADLYSGLAMTAIKGWVEDGIGYLQLDRPKAMNALDADLTLQSIELLKAFIADEEVKVIIVIGSEKVFCAGGDIVNMSKIGVSQALDAINGTHTFLNLLNHGPKPTIAAVRGLALGGGMEILLACDMNVIAEDATFGFPEINLGIFPGGGGTQRMARFSSISATKYYVLTGDFFNAPEAYRLGVANFVVPADQVLEKAAKIAKKLKTKSPIALRSAKQCVNYGHDVDIKTGCDFERMSWSQLFGTEDQKEGMQAFLEKRAATFTGQVTVSIS